MDVIKELVKIGFKIIDIDTYCNGTITKSNIYTLKDENNIIHKIVYWCEGDEDG